MPSANEEQLRRRNLPHWDVPGTAYFVTTCLEGSIPATGRLDMANHRDELKQRPRPTGLSENDWETTRWKLGFARMEHWLDERPAIRHLADPALAGIVVDALRFFEGVRYDLLAFAVMPSHLHWVFRPSADWIAGFESSTRSPRQRIVHSINRHTALRCNAALETAGSFWQRESYDHWIRDARELERIVLYVEGNPVKAKLVESAELWPFSSAYRPVISG